MSTSPLTKEFLGWQDFTKLFECGRTKAEMLMRKVGVVYIGRSAFVRTEDLEAYLAEHESIDIKWPKSSARRRGARNARK